jgi:hypothetical protein
MESRHAYDTTDHVAERERATRSLAETLAVLLRPLLSSPGEAADPESDTMHRVREVVCAFASEWKAAGEPPEKVVVGVKTALRLALREDGSQETLRLLTRRAVQWCIGAYYRAD